jgi:hypothetical protein
MKRLLTLIPFLFLLFGCASAELKLNLDIYKEDPFESAPISIKQLIRIQNGIDALERESATLANNRKNLGDNLLTTYKEIYFVITKAKKPDFSRNQLDSEISRFEDQLFDYKTSIDKKRGNINMLAESARKTLGVFSKRLKKNDKSDEVSELHVLNAINQLEKAVLELGGPFHTSFETGLIQNWSVVPKMASTENLRTLFEKDHTPLDLSALRATAERYSKVIDELKTNGYKIPEEAIKALHTGLENLQTPTPSALSSSLEAIAMASTTLSPSIGLGDRGATELNLLVKATSLLYSQIDRLQDPADPVWRIISDPENESKWNKEFSETYFNAQGNSSVVVVRDTPISFRQQRGTNNPTALIQNQLLISRAIGNAAISIASATTGIPISLAPDSDQNGTPPANDNAAAESEALARRKAMAEEHLRQRTQALRNFRNNLISISEEFRLKESDKTLKDYPVLKSRLETILKAHRPFFRSVQSN